MNETGASIREWIKSEIEQGIGLSIEWGDGPIIRGVIGASGDDEVCITVRVRGDAVHTVLVEIATRGRAVAEDESSVPRRSAMLAMNRLAGVVALYPLLCGGAEGEAE